MNYWNDTKFTAKIPNDSGYFLVRTLARTKHDDVVKLFFDPSKPDSEKYCANTNPPLFGASPWELLINVRKLASERKNPIYRDYIVYGDRPTKPLD